ncbi:MAG: ABC transporter permease [Chloroflexota bacterium]|nr:ABC transporter permease [Chloroflexota bacterium]
MVQIATQSGSRRTGWRPTFWVQIEPIYGVLLAVFVAGWIAVSLRGGQFLTLTNITNMFVRSISLGLVSIGQTLVILGGSLDLSVAYMVSVAAVISSVVMQGQPDRMVLGIGAALLAGLTVGLANGLIITRFRVNPFITTLGTALIMRGLLNASFENFSGAVPPEFQALGYDSIGPVPWSILLLLALAAAAWAVTRYTGFGYHLYAVGGNEETARLSGIRSGRVLVAAHVLCSLTAVLTALFIVSRLRAGAPWVGPDGGYDLESIAAVVLGGTALAGGRGSVLGTLAGVLIFAIIDNVFNEFQVDPFLKTLLRGIIIVGAVASYSLRNRAAGMRA